MRPEDVAPGGSKLDYAAFWAVLLLLVAATWLYFRLTRGRRGVARLVVGNLLVFACLLWTAAVAGETYLRWFYDQTDQYGLVLTNADWFMRHCLLNAREYRDVEWKTEKPAGVVRVACVGDSFTMGWGVKDMNDTWPRLVGAGLDATSPGKFEVRNYGVAGVDADYETDHLVPIAAQDRCDRVILGYCLNDTDYLLPKDRVFDRDDAPRVFTGTHSHLASFLWYRLRLRGDQRVRGYFDWEKEAYDDPKIWGAQTQKFAQMLETCRQRAMRLDVVVFPFFHAWGPDYPFDTCHDRVVETWKRLGVDAIDLREAYKGIASSDLVVNRFDAHPNERAHAVAARVILERAFGVRR